MDEINAIFQLDFVSIIISIFIVMSAVVSTASLIGKFSVIIGKPVKWIKKKNKDHELLICTVKNVESLQSRHEETVKQSIRHDDMIKDDISKLSETVNGIANTLTEMQQKSNDTELKKLKDTLVGYYNKFKNVGEWSKLDANVFWDLFDDYEKRGGDGYVHSIIEPVMRELKEI